MKKNKTETLASFLFFPSLFFGTPPAAVRVFATRHPRECGNLLAIDTPRLGDPRLRGDLPDE
jgi:hypothetical protein